MSRLDVRKTSKLFIGGAFPRSESGRTSVVTTADGEFAANVARASRKDARDAVEAAHRARPGWWSRTGYNRGQVLYRVAEMLEGRREQVVAEVLAAEGGSRRSALAQVDAAVDRWVWYAGWADKLAQVLGSTNPVAGPFLDLSIPEPTGVVAVIAPHRSSFLGLVSVLAPVVVSGNAAVTVASQRRPLPAMTLAEVLATSDLPGGVVNVLTGEVAEILPWLASHTGVDGLDLTGVPDAELAADAERAGAENLKRILRPPASEPRWTDRPDLERMSAFTEIKTVWHPVGL